MSADGVATRAPPRRAALKRQGKRKLCSIEEEYVMALERAKAGLRSGDLKLVEREIDWMLETLWEKL